MGHRHDVSVHIVCATHEARDAASASLNVPLDGDFRCEARVSASTMAEVEGKLDEVCARFPDLRYMLETENAQGKGRRRVHINKNGRKITTRKAVRHLCL